MVIYPVLHIACRTSGASSFFHKYMVFAAFLAIAVVPIDFPFNELEKLNF